MNNEYNEVGRRIKAIRMKKQLSRETLAEEADISERFLFDIEHGRKGFSAYILQKLALALEVSCDTIMFG